MWTQDADDRAFLHELSYEIIAAVAPEELSNFTALIGNYFANPGRSLVRPRPQALRQHTYLTPVTPAVIVAVLNLLLFEIESVAQYDQSDIVMLALKRLFRQRGARPYERSELRPIGASEDLELSLVALLYTRPVAITVPLTRIAGVAYETANLYGLSATRADDLVPLTVSRLLLGPSAFHGGD